MILYAKAEPGKQFLGSVIINLLQSSVTICAFILFQTAASGCKYPFALPPLAA